MVPPPDETPESLDGQVTRGGEPDRPVEKSIGERDTVGNDPSTDSGGEAFGEDWMPPEMLADRYRLEEKIGQGGMGVVYRAHDANLNITIAVKLISGGTIERFRTEAQSIAALNHPSIVRVYEFNQQDGLYYIVMEHVAGESLLDRLRRDGTIPTEEALRITIALCEALSHAHGKGIIHRDIKPSNVLLSDEGVPKLVDFGLARIDSDDGQLTRGGLGTPAYVAPEQAKDGTLADARSDLWSLAASLYHMITGRIPRVIRLHDLADSLQEVLSKALEDVPDSRYQSADDFRDALKVALDSPVAHQPRTVPEGELAKGQCRECGAINEADREFCGACGEKIFQPCLACEVEIGVWEQFCGKCGANIQQLVEERQQQYRDALERIETLCRDSRHQEALSETSDLLEFEHPLFVKQAEQLRQALEIAREELKSLEADRAKAISDARQQSNRGKFVDAINLLDRTPQALRESSWQAEMQRMVEGRDELAEIQAAVREKRHDGLMPKVSRYLELHPGDEAVQAIHSDLVEQRERQDEQDRQSQIKQLASRIQTAKQNKSYDGLLPDVEKYLQLCPNDEPMETLAGKLRAREEDRRLKDIAAARKRKLRITSGVVVAGVLLLLVVSVPLRYASRLAAEKAAAKLVSEKLAAEKAAAERRAAEKAAAEQLAAKQEAERRVTKSVQTLKGHSDSVRSVSFSPDGKRIVSGGFDDTIRIWDAQTGQETLKLEGHSISVNSVSFSPDGKRIVSCGRGLYSAGDIQNEIKVWDAQTGQETLTLKGNSDGVNSVSFSPDGKRIVSGGGEYDSFDLAWISVWDAQTGQKMLTLKGHTGHVDSVSFSPDGKRIVSSGGRFQKTGEIKVWDAQTGRETLTLKGHLGSVSSVSFSPDGKRIVSGSSHNTLKVWDAQTGQETLTLTGHAGSVSSVSFSPDGKRIVTGSRDRSLKVWDAQTGQETLTLKGHSGLVTSVSFSPDGKRIVSGSWDRSLKVWDISLLDKSK